uniref:Uncharacterized protein n=1 Tax=Strongyloides stercoralis TaxID=6248 RepID=A0A0K0EQZ5_STRER
MILTLFLIEIYLFLVVSSESVNFIYYNTKNLNKKLYSKSNYPRSPISYSSNSQSKSKYNYVKSQQSKKYSNVKAKHSLRYYSIITQPASKANTLTIPTSTYTTKNNVPFQYYQNVKPITRGNYYVNNNYLRPYQYYYYPNNQYYSQYYSQYYYPSTQTQYNYTPNKLPSITPLQYELTYPHKGHGFIGNELAQFWLICHDCPRG